MNSLMIHNHTVVRKRLYWGTFGKAPKNYDIENVQWVLIKDLSNNHIAAILKTELWHLPNYYISTLRTEIIYRADNGISVPDVVKYYTETEESKK